MKALSYGGGVDSTALAILLANEGRPPLAVFADTGGEWPETIAFVEVFRRWYEARGGELVTVKPPESLEAYSLRTGRMPMRRLRWCTDRFKIEPVRKHLDAIRQGEAVTLFVGIDADEAHRAQKSDRDPKWITKVFPLFERDLGRDDCIRIIERAGLQVPPKSGCFFCPYQRLDGWRMLYRNRPDLYARAEAIEAADPGSMREGWSLGRYRLPVMRDRFDREASQCALPFPKDREEAAPCGCWDGN